MESSPAWDGRAFRKGEGLHPAPKKKEAAPVLSGSLLAMSVEG